MRLAGQQLTGVLQVRNDVWMGPSAGPHRQKLRRCQCSLEMSPHCSGGTSDEDLDRGAASVCGFTWQLLSRGPMASAAATWLA